MHHPQTATKLFCACTALLFALGAATLPAHALENIIWHATDLGGVAVPQDMAPVTAKFEDGHISGSTGCNRYGGTYTAGEGQTLYISSLQSTMRACEGDVMGREARFLTLLEQAASYTTSRDGTLVIYTTDGTALRLAPSGN